jgi:predicted GNAT family N-acyltransferase
VGCRPPCTCRSATPVRRNRAEVCDSGDVVHASAGVRVATGADVLAASRILSDGFRLDPVMQWVFADGIDAALERFFHFMLSEALIPLGATYVTESCCAVWTPPGKDPWARADVGNRFLAAMDSVLTRDQLDRMVTLNLLVDQIHPQEPHWYLGMIATRADAQGTGAGARMMRHTLEPVDADGLPAFLESTNPTNIPFYQRQGFVIVGEAKLPDGPGLTQMRRTPPATTLRC